MSEFVWQLLIIPVVASALGATFRFIPDRFAFWRSGIVIFLLLIVWWVARATAK
jgi:hypothetical protein